jgi:hypothetical protein
MNFSPSKRGGMMTSPHGMPVHQELYPGSRTETILANHYYWIQRCAKDEAMKLK